jgi:hypothetical protein
VLILVLIKHLIYYSEIRAFGISFFEKQNSLNYQMYYSIGKSQQAKFAKSCVHTFSGLFLFERSGVYVERTTTLIDSMIGLTQISADDLLINSTLSSF